MANENTATENLCTEVSELYKEENDDTNAKCYKRLKDHAEETFKSDSSKYPPILCLCIARAAYYLADVAKNKGDKNECKRLALESHEFACKAVEGMPEDFLSCKWAALAKGYASDYVSIREKIEMGKEMRELLERAIKINPNENSVHHLLGRYLYNIYMLTWYERSIVRIVFGSDQHATAEEALASFEKAEELLPNAWKVNELYMAKCFIELKKYDKAIEWLEKGEALPIKQSSDQLLQDEIQSLLKKYRKK